MGGLPPGYILGGLRIQLGDLVLNTVDAQGVGWYCASMDGWDSPDTRTTLTEREADHGAWAGPVYLQERVVTLAGKAYAPSPDGVFGAVEQLKTANSLGDQTLTVYETVPRQLTVRRSGKLLAQRLTDQVVDWSIQMTAADPRLYATTQTVTTLRLPSVTGGLQFPATFPVEFDATVIAGDTTITNDGTIDARPTIVINGPVSQPLVTVTDPDGTAMSLLYGGDIAAGDWVVLDCDAHTAYYNGVASRRALVSGDWPTLLPGASGLSFRAGAYSATATCTITYRSAWM
jgi:hypothetical protein